MKSPSLTELIKKYNVPGPRYTSYPTAVQFDELDSVSVGSYLQQRNSSPREISLYIHLPFCASLCWYCGCNTIITRDKSRADDYLDYLEKEMTYYSKMMHPGHRVTQVHYGGGTPTFLTPNQLDRLAKMIHSLFNVDVKAEFGVEIDPRTFTTEHLEALVRSGMNRASIGFQDVNREVQEAIHRVQPYEMVEACMEDLRSAGVGSVNLDVIYGLPLQTRERFACTLSAVKALNPDRVAIYSYAHVPWIRPAQKLLEKHDLPSADDKMQLLTDAITFMQAAGMDHIGMDHFAKPNDELTIALRDHSLQRNFQGYSTKAGLDLYAFGVSSISSIGPYYIQNHKDSESYKRAINETGAAWAKGVKLSREDEFRRNIIMHLMCSRSLSFREIWDTWYINAAEHFKKELGALKPLENDKLIQINPDGIEILPKGRFFLRNVAMAFDQYLSEKSGKAVYSKTV
ncbi:MAG: oxygen-independent coproporphyrinogen III oxidase [Balneolales bacterium]|nr:oxygen-independent coproporphyrinogen III oxidase [Balneolales bacterium]